jgi:hypothetical protein
MRRIMQSVGLVPGLGLGGNGREAVLKRIPNYNRAARVSPFVVLVDFERNQGCVGAFVQRVLPAPSQLMRLRVAVRSIESWFMADADGLAGYLNVPIYRIPAQPDTVAQPKLQMVNLAKRSRSSVIRREMVPREGSGSSVGPAYTSRMQEFARLHWNIERAADASPSLLRSLRALRTLAACD